MGTLLTVAQRMLSFYPQSGLSKEGSDQMGLVPKTSDGQVELLVQLLEVATREVPHLHVLEGWFQPPFVPLGVEVGGITRQGLHPDCVAACP